MEFFELFEERNFEKSVVLYDFSLGLRVWVLVKIKISSDFSEIRRMRNRRRFGTRIILHLYETSKKETKLNKKTPTQCFD